MSVVKSCRNISRLHSLHNSIFLRGLANAVNTKIIHFLLPSAAKILAVICCLFFPWKNCPNTVRRFRIFKRLSSLCICTEFKTGPLFDS